MSSDLTTYEFPLPTSLFISKSEVLPLQYAPRMDNIEWSQGVGLNVRRGYRNVDVVSSLLTGDEYIHYVIGYNGYNHVICFARDEVAATSRVIVYEPATDTIVADHDDANAFDTPVSHLEVTTGASNNPILLFYAGKNPYTIKRDLMDDIPQADDYRVLESGIDYGSSSNNLYAYSDPSGGIVYKSRLYLFKAGFNEITYLPAGVVSGEPKKLNVENIFGAKGNIINIVVTGFSAGAGVQSWLSVLFDSGDILNFSGLDPDSVNDWRAESIVSINGRIYPGSLNYGTSVYIMTEYGVLDLANVIANNGIVVNATIGLEINEGLQGQRGNYRLYQLGERIMLRHVLYPSHYVLNTRYNTWCKYTNFEVIEGSTLGSNLYFVKQSSSGTETFAYGKKLLEGFDYVDDDGEIITAVLHSTWHDMGNRRNKNFSYAYMNMGYDGEYEASLDYDFDYERVLSNRTPFDVKNEVVTWHNFSGKAWSVVKTLLWAGNRALAVGGWKLSRTGQGSAVSFRVNIAAKSSVGCMINKLICEYKQDGR